MDIKKQIDYWRKGSEEEIEIAELLFSQEKYRHALSLAHLAIEKIIKAHVVVKTKTVPPRIHNLLKLSEIAEIHLPEDIADFLGRFEVYQIETRYPGTIIAELTKEKASSVYSEAKKALTWIKEQFKER